MILPQSIFFQVIKKAMQKRFDSRMAFLFGSEAEQTEGTVPGDAGKDE